MLRLERSTLQQIIPVLLVRKSGAHRQAFSSQELVGALFIMVPTISKGSQFHATYLCQENRRVSRVPECFRSAVDAPRFCRTHLVPVGVCVALPLRRLRLAILGLSSRIPSSRGSLFSRATQFFLGNPWTGATGARRVFSCRGFVSSFIHSAAFESDLLLSLSSRECSRLPRRPRSTLAARSQR